MQRCGSQKIMIDVDSSRRWMVNNAIKKAIKQNRVGQNDEDILDFLEGIGEETTGSGDF